MKEWLIFYHFHVQCAGQHQDDKGDMAPVTRQLCYRWHARAGPMFLLR